VKILVLPVLLCIIQASPSIPRKATDTANATPQNNATNSSHDKTAPNPMPAAVEDVAAAPQANAGSASKNENADQSVRIREIPSVSVSRDWIDCLSIGFTGILVIVGSLGVRAAYRTIQSIDRQTDATRKSAEATEKSVRLQETQLRQWVDIRELGCRNVLPNSTEITECTLVFYFEILNPTNMPLTLEWIVTRIGQTKQSAALHHLLAPNNSYPREASTFLRNNLFNDFKAYKLIQNVIITVGFKDAFDNDRKQTFAFTCLCGPPNMCRISPFEGSVPNDEVHKQLEK
jgi:hypothetical protein